MENIALVVGATGIAGRNLALELLQQGWRTYGIARHPRMDIHGLEMIKADLLDRDNLALALQDVRPTHVFFTTWMRQDSEEKNIAVNSALVRNLLDVLSPKGSVRHVALVTGLKHYLGPFDAYAKEGKLPETPLREEQPRLNLPNFYYAQEDEVYAAAARDGFGWSIHRPHTVIGKAVGNLMNMGTTLAVYATICRELDLPFIFPGSEAQWNGLSDVTDARMLAKHMVWAATAPAARNEAMNITNGDVFRWKWLWQQIADHFGVRAEGYNGTIRPLEGILKGHEETWQRLAEKRQLKVKVLHELASAWHTDLDLGRPIEVMTDMSKSRKLGFTAYQSTRDSFFDLFDTLKQEGLI